MCPGVDDIQHGDSCRLNKDTGKAVCDCKEGYIGEHCDRCDVFYHGNPLEKGGECQKCKCSGNVDELDPSSCDSKTGQCLKCLYNTFGNNCEVCKHGYHGSAIHKTCYECQCDPRGTEGNSDKNCDNITGQCKCLPNVEGKRCDAPKEDCFWNPNDNGTLSCDCDASGTVSGSLVCDKNTGQCPCTEERGGKTCNECAERKWGDPLQGCKSKTV
jgi:hypothetical protein